MSLFQYGFCRVVPEAVSPPVPSHIPELEEAPGLSVEEHANLAAAVSDLADPTVLSHHYLHLHHFCVNLMARPQS